MLSDRLKRTKKGIKVSENTCPYWREKKHNLQASQGCWAVCVVWSTFMAKVTCTTGSQGEHRPTGRHRCLGKTFVLWWKWESVERMKKKQRVVAKVAAWDSVLRKDCKASSRKGETAPLTGARFIPWAAWRGQGSDQATALPQVPTRKD